MPLQESVADKIFSLFRPPQKQAPKSVRLSLRSLENAYHQKYKRKLNMKELRELPFIQIIDNFNNTNTNTNDNNNNNNNQNQNQNQDRIVLLVIELDDCCNQCKFPYCKLLHNVKPNDLCKSFENNQTCKHGNKCDHIHRPNIRLIQRIKDSMVENRLESITLLQLKKLHNKRYPNAASHEPTINGMIRFKGSFDWEQTGKDYTITRKDKSNFRGNNKGFRHPTNSTLKSGQNRSKNQSGNSQFGSSGTGVRTSGKLKLGTSKAFAWSKRPQPPQPQPTTNQSTSITQPNKVQLNDSSSSLQNEPLSPKSQKSSHSSTRNGPQNGHTTKQSQSSHSSQQSLSNRSNNSNDNDNDNKSNDQNSANGHISSPPGINNNNNDFNNNRNYRPKKPYNQRGSGYRDGPQYRERGYNRGPRTYNTYHGTTMEHDQNLAPHEAKEMRHEHYQEFDERGDQYPHVLIPEQGDKICLLIKLNPKWNDNKLVIELVRHISRATGKHVCDAYIEGRYGYGYFTTKTREMAEKFIQSAKNNEINCKGRHVVADIIPMPKRDIKDGQKPLENIHGTRVRVKNVNCVMGIKDFNNWVRECIFGQPNRGRDPRDRGCVTDIEIVFPRVQRGVSHCLMLFHNIANAENVIETLNNEQFRGFPLQFSKWDHPKFQAKKMAMQRQRSRGHPNTRTSPRKHPQQQRPVVKQTKPKQVSSTTVRDKVQPLQRTGGTRTTSSNKTWAQFAKQQQQPSQPLQPVQQQNIKGAKPPIQSSLNIASEGQQPGSSNVPSNSIVNNVAPSLTSSLPESQDSNQQTSTTNITTPGNIQDGLQQHQHQQPKQPTKPPASIASMVAPPEQPIIVQQTTLPQQQPVQVQIQAQTQTTQTSTQEQTGPTVPPLTTTTNTKIEINQNKDQLNDSIEKQIQIPQIQNQSLITPVQTTPQHQIQTQQTQQPQQPQQPLQQQQASMRTPSDQPIIEQQPLQPPQPHQQQQQQQMQVPQLIRMVIPGPNGTFVTHFMYRVMINGVPYLQLPNQQQIGQSAQLQFLQNLPQQLQMQPQPQPQIHIPTQTTQPSIIPQMSQIPQITQPQLSQNLTNQLNQSQQLQQQIQNTQQLQRIVPFQPNIQNPPILRNQNINPNINQSMNPNMNMKLNMNMNMNTNVNQNQNQNQQQEQSVTTVGRQQFEATNQLQSGMSLQSEPQSEPQPEPQSQPQSQPPQHSKKKPPRATLCQWCMMKTHDPDTCWFKPGDSNHPNMDNGNRNRNNQHRQRGGKQSGNNNNNNNNKNKNNNENQYQNRLQNQNFDNNNNNNNKFQTNRNDSNNNRYRNQRNQQNRYQKTNYNNSNNNSNNSNNINGHAKGNSNFRSNNNNGNWYRRSNN